MLVLAKNAAITAGDERRLDSKAALRERVDAQGLTWTRSADWTALPPLARWSLSRP